MKSLSQCRVVSKMTLVYYFSCHGDPVNRSKELWSQEQLTFHSFFSSWPAVAFWSPWCGKYTAFWMPGWPTWRGVGVGQQESGPSLFTGAHTDCSARAVAASLLGKMLFQSSILRDREGPQPASQHLSFLPVLCDLQQSLFKSPLHTLRPTQSSFLSFPPIALEETGHERFHRVLDTALHTVISGMCGSDAMASSMLTFSFSS